MGLPGVCVFNPHPVAAEGLVDTVSSREVAGRIKGLRPGMAPSPGGIKGANFSDVQGVENLFSGLFNVLLSTGHCPESWLMNSTSKITKAGRDLSESFGWRPITVGCALARIFGALMESRIRSFVGVSPRQKGFVEGNDCFANTLLLHELIRRGKTSSLAVSQLDLTRALDSVPHEALFWGSEGYGKAGVFGGDGILHVLGGVHLL